MIDVVLLELEGVLAQTGPLRADALARALAVDGVALTPDAFEDRCAGLPTRAAVLAATAGRVAEPDETAVDLAVLRAEREFSALLGHGLLLAEGAVACLERLRARARLAVVTRAARRDVETIVALAGLDGVFEVVVAAEDAGESKPSPAGYEQALARLARRRPVDRARAVALEDGAAGIAAAHGAGLRCVAVGPLPAYRALAAEAYLPSLEGQTVESLSMLIAGDEERVS